MSHGLLVLEHGNISEEEQGFQGARALREILPEETLTKAAFRKNLPDTWDEVVRSPRKSGWPGPEGSQSKQKLRH